MKHLQEYLTATVFIVLLMWGPIDHSWPFWLAIRLGYLAIIPLLCWLAVGWLANRLLLSDKEEDVVERVFWGLVSVAVCVFAWSVATAKHHIENTKWVRTREGMEDVGDDIVVAGPDWGWVCFLVVFAAIVFWFGVLRKEPNERKSRY